jgi:ribosomal protein S18 acetylase RimI-like enzyme
MALDGVEVREAVIADAAALAVVGAATLLDAFAGLVPGDSLLAHCAKHHHAAAYVAYFEKPETRVWIAEVPPGAAPVGYAMVTAPDFPVGLAGEGDLELRRIYVLTRFHGGGAGRRLMEKAIAHARAQRANRLLLGVHPDNQRALAFYRRNGFVQIGTRTFHVGASVFEDPVFALDLQSGS